MSVPSNPPPTLKPVSHYLKVALEHDTRDKVIAYWARFAAVQKALSIDKSSPEAKMFVIQLLEWLEKQKKELAGNEAITIEAAGEAHVENYALKLFSWADSNDKNAIFNKNVVKAFYTAGILFDILESLTGSLSEEFSTARKYAKWKAAYIHNCLKNGETPIPGGTEPAEDEDEFSVDNPGTSSGGAAGGFYGFVNPHQPELPPQQPHQQPTGGVWGSSDTNFNSSGGASGFENAYVPPPAAPLPTPTVPEVTGGSGPAGSLSVEQIAKAQKYCKWAGSALNFDDVNSAIENLEKALHLLKTGQDI